MPIPSTNESSFAQINWNAFLTRVRSFLSTTDQMYANSSFIRFGSGSAYVTHDQITLSLLADTEGSALISAARGELDEDRTAEWIAHNMVAWFSQRITVGESDWAERFDRQKIDGKWAYRPTSSGP